MYIRHLCGWSRDWEQTDRLPSPFHTSRFLPAAAAACCSVPRARPACVQRMQSPNSLPDDYMDAVTFQGECTVSFQRVSMPQLQLPSDVVVRIDLCGLCGSDLHPYHC
jgi:hypothetical protein